MKRIEAVVRRSEMKHFCQCAEKLGIFGFDLCEDGCSTPRAVGADGHNQSKLKVDFAVFDAETKDTVQAVLEQAHPDSIGIFQLGPESTASEGARRGFYSNRRA